MCLERKECLEYPVETRTHTALHVVKGAIVKVLGEQALWTASVYVSGNHGRITVTCNEKPSKEMIKMIEEKANEAIDKDLKIEVIKLPRSKAEEKYGRIIYDLFPVPEHVKELSIVIIHEDNGYWNINACNKEHLPSTKCIGQISIKKVRFRAKKKLLEVSFDIEP
ncbi:MAG: hypothetical protein J7L82_00235 [Staphylothermus sp.]|nr:hypothetical protein [Staphylothermus sp.]